MEDILLLGASLVEYGYVSNWVSRLCAHYSRRATVHNLGLAGYNSRWLLQILEDDALLEKMVPYPVAAEGNGGKKKKRPLFVTLMVGSNDCSIYKQHVPVGEYKSNLHKIIRLIREKLNPKGGIYLMTIPPIDHEHWRRHRQIEKTDRTFAGSRQYRDAMVEVVAEEAQRRRGARAQTTNNNNNKNSTDAGGDGGDVFVVDVFHTILYHGIPQRPPVSPAGAAPTRVDAYDANAPWTRLLYDGLHVNDVGGEIFFTTLLDALRRSPYAPQIAAENLKFVFPSYEDILAGRATISSKL